MRLGFGTTVLEKGLTGGHMDGIGVYAANLWHRMQPGALVGIERLQGVTFDKRPPVETEELPMQQILHLPP